MHFQFNCSYKVLNAQAEFHYKNCTFFSGVWLQYKKISSLINSTGCNYLENIRRISRPSNCVELLDNSSGSWQLQMKGLRSKHRNSPYIFQVVASLPTKACSYYCHYIHWHTILSVLSFAMDKCNQTILIMIYV
jgi:hypothetical protein